MTDIRYTAAWVPNDAEHRPWEVAFALAADWIEAQCGQAFLHLWRRNAFDNLSMEQGDNVLRCFGRDQDSHPVLSLQFRVPRFRHGWNVWQKL